MMSGLGLFFYSVVNTHHQHHSQNIGRRTFRLVYKTDKWLKGLLLTLTWNNIMIINYKCLCRDSQTSQSVLILSRFLSVHIWHDPVEITGKTFFPSSFSFLVVKLVRWPWRSLKRSLHFQKTKGNCGEGVFESFWFNFIFSSWNCHNFRRKKYYVFHLTLVLSVIINQNSTGNLISQTLWVLNIVTSSVESVWQCLRDVQG